MLGYDVRITKLKAQPTRELLLEAESRGYSDGLDYLQTALRGDPVGYIPHIFQQMNFPIYGSIPLLEEESPNTADPAQGDSPSSGQLIYGGGYPTILTALGEEILQKLSEKKEFLTEVDPEILYLVTIWDQS